jgi:uncharacterized protein
MAESKKIYDSVHGFIHFDPQIEKELINSYPFQRLHYISQLGVVYLVYPGATHCRFSHSLGVMDLASKMYKTICTNVRPDLLDVIPRKGSAEYIYWKKILRLAALCHDLGHLPFSHVAEKSLLGSKGHEFWTMNIIQSSFLTSVWDNVQKTPLFHSDLTNRDVVEDVLKLALGEDKISEIFPSKKISFTNWERILSKMISGDFFGADRIDYLLRDARATGLVYGLFDYYQLIDRLRILPSLEKKGDLDLGIDENALESSEALLLARHFMFKRVYLHPVVKAYAFHLKRFMKILYSSLEFFRNVENYLSMTDNSILHALEIAAKDKGHQGHEDAKRLIYRRRPFKAILLPDLITEEQLKSFQKMQGIDEEKMEWDFGDKDSVNSIHFPVARKNLSIEKASNCSALLSVIPSVSNHWLYIAPELEARFIEKVM